MNTLKGKKVDLKRNTSPSSMSAGLSIKRAPIQKKVNYVCSFDSSNYFQKSCLKNLGSYNLGGNSSFNSCSTIMTPKTQDYPFHSWRLSTHMFTVHKISMCNQESK